MRFIAVLGVLFVLGSCSDSDMEENFALSCYKTDSDETFIHFFEFDFDKNIVIRDDGSSDYDYYVTEVSPVKIVFVQRGLVDIDYVLDRANLNIEQTIFYNQLDKRTIFKCKLPQI